jgi:hypothetical protein
MMLAVAATMARGKKVVSAFIRSGNLHINACVLLGQVDVHALSIHAMYDIMCAAPIEVLYAAEAWRPKAAPPVTGVTRA